MNPLLADLQKKNGLRKQIDSTLHEKLNHGNTFLNPMIILKNQSSETINMINHLNLGHGNFSNTAS